MKNWGYLNDEDNAKLCAVAASFSKKVGSIKTEKAMETQVRQFMKEYLGIGEDPTDTVIVVPPKNVTPIFLTFQIVDVSC